jgi:hypothetical protein
MIDKAIYARINGITVEEAVERFELMDEIGPLGAALEEQEKETFAGLWVEHDPFRMNIAFTGNGEETVRKYVEEGSPLDGILELRTFAASLEELKAAQMEAGQLLSGLGSTSVPAVMVTENRVEVLRDG